MEMIKKHTAEFLFISSLLRLLPVLVVLGCSLSVPRDENLIKNGDFEDVTRGQLNMWSTEIYGDDVESVRFYVESEGAYSGKHYVTIENIQPNDAKLLQYVRVKPETFYRLSCRIKTENVDIMEHGATITIRKLRRNLPDVKETGGEWKYVEVYGRTKKNQRHVHVAARFGGYGSLNTGKASFDDCRMEEIEKLPAGVNVIKLFR